MVQYHPTVNKKQNPQTIHVLSGNIYLLLVSECRTNVALTSIRPSRYWKCCSSGTLYGLPQVLMTNNISSNMEVLLMFFPSLSSWILDRSFLKVGTFSSCPSDVDGSTMMLREKERGLGKKIRVDYLLTGKHTGLPKATVLPAKTS